jgi:hypothetical protein
MSVTCEGKISKLQASFDVEMLEKIRLMNDTDQHPDKMNELNLLLSNVQQQYLAVENLFKSSNHAYIYNLMPELSSIGDIRRCITVNNTDPLQHFYNTVLDSIPDAHEDFTRVVFPKEVSLKLYLKIMGPTLHLLNTLMSHKPVPSRREVNDLVYQLQITEILQDTLDKQDKSEMLEKYLKTLEELDQLRSDDYYEL